MVTRSKVDANGRETMIVCIKCSLDNRNICNGTKIVLVNNHKNNSFSIYKSTIPNGFQELKKGKENTLELSEFEKWLEDNNYVEDCNLACGKQL
jgi:hypothetical protein